MLAQLTCIVSALAAIEAGGEGGEAAEAQDSAAACACEAEPQSPAPPSAPAPRWNLASNPLGWIVGLYGGSVTAVVAEHLSIRLDANYFTPIATESRGYELGMGLPIYVFQTFQGPFVEPGFVVRRFGDAGAEPIFGPQVLAGWHVSWRHRLNAAFALGMGRDVSRADDRTYANFFLNGYLRFGYAF
jgi:hypothetical protein